MYGSTNTFVFEQTTPSDVWTIVHNLGVKAPIVDTWLDLDGSTVKVMPERVEHVNPLTCKVYFNSPQQGTAVVA